MNRTRFLQIFFPILTRFPLLTLSSTFILSHFLRSNTFLRYNFHLILAIQWFDSHTNAVISNTWLYFSEQALESTAKNLFSHSSLSFTFSHFTDTKLTVLFALFVPFCVPSSFLLPLFRPLLDRFDCSLQLEGMEGRSCDEGNTSCFFLSFSLPFR